MSNSIWKTDNLQEADTRKQILFYAGGGQFLYLGWNHPAWGMILAGSADWKYGDIQKWCYLDDLIAQADKAERLRKALCFIRNIRGAGMSYQDMFLDAHEVAKTALDPEYKPVLFGRYDEEMLDEIKQLIKGE